jgi:hypothetical protein
MEDGEIRARAAALLAGGLSDEEALAKVAATTSGTAER